jgi:hypothetical protein
MALNTYSDISGFVTTVYEDALFVVRDNNVMAALVATFNDRMGLAPRTGSEYNSVTINEVGESDDLVSQSFTPSVLSTLTPSEKAAQFFLTDSRIESDSFGAQADASTELGVGLAQKVETDLLALATSFTGGTIGAVATVPTWGWFMGALTKLRAQNAPMPYYAVFHPNQWHYLGTAVVPAGAQTNAPQFQDEVMRNFYVGNVAGVSIFVSSNVTLTGGTAATGGMFARPAIGLDWRRAPRLEPQRDASRRGWELNLSTVYAAGVWRPKFGVQMISNAATPS